MAAHSARPLANGRIALAYDPRIAEPMHNAPPQPIDLWAVWQAIRLPVLVLRGAESDVLSPETLARMEAEGARSLVVAGAGHAPSLQNPAEIATIRDFLS
jgi:pimeloyl-ACP methyl ester carboxylesterase